MTLLAIDQIDACPLLNSNIVWPSSITNYLRGIQTYDSNGRFGIFSGEFSERMLSAETANTYGGHGSIYINTTSPTKKHIIGGAIRIRPLGTGNPSADRSIFAINNVVAASTSVSGSMDYSVMLRDDDTVSVGTNKSAVGVFPVNTFVYIEAVFDPFDGSVEVYVNNALVVSGVLPFESISRIGFRINADGTPDRYGYDLDNFYILNDEDTGDGYTYRLGPIAVQRLPLATEASTTFTPVGAATNIDAVNKTTLSTDSYVRSPQADDQSDLFEVDSSIIDDSKDILGMVVAPYFRKTDVGARDLAGVATDGINEVERTFTDADTTFRGSSTPLIMATAPDGDPWTKAKIAACEFGYKVKA